MQKSVLTKSQLQKTSKKIDYDGDRAILTTTIKYDDECGNGHNSFAITGSIRIAGQRDFAICGCIHEEILQYSPELAHLIPWHLCSSDGPLHYLANTLYLAGDVEYNGKTKARHLKAARESAIWPEATDEELMSDNLEQKLKDRLPQLLIDFKAAMEKAGFAY